jgi:acyl-CoA reductase-like NAD-dependent aldehyde dehydrogenase
LDSVGFDSDHLNKINNFNTMNDRVISVFNPFSQEKIGEVQQISLEEVDEVVRNANTAKESMGALPAFQRAEILHFIANGIRSRKDQFAEMIAKESAKPLIYAQGEVERAIETFTIAAEETLRIPSDLFGLDRTPKGKGLLAEYHYFPAGVVFGIAPFNFPLNLAVHKIAPAFAVGCPIILKPSSKTPLTMELLKAVIDESGIPQYGFQLVHCSRETGDKFIEHPDIHVLSFTGSPEIGWELKSRAGKKKVVLELGGNAAAIVCEDADIENAVNELLVGAFAYSGQVCIHTQRIYIQKKQFDFFASQFVARAKQLKVEDPLKRETQFSVMIDAQNALRVATWIDEAVRAGAKVIIGGKHSEIAMEPTILTNVPKGQKIRDEEVFGPVVILESFESLEQAIDEVNDCRWGLQASIFTDSISNRDLAFKQLAVGGLIHNQATTFRVDEMPYGGIKDSGFGREGVRYTMMDYMEGKLLVRKWKN